MQMWRYSLPVFSVGRNAERIPSHRARAKKRNAGEPGFLHRFPTGHGLKIGVAVVMAACPAPGVINVMIYHQRMRTSGIDDPGGSGQMADRIVPRIQLRAKRLPSKPNLIGCCQLMLIKRLKACKFSEKQRPSLLYGNMDCRCAGCFNISRCFLS